MTAACTLWLIRHGETDWNLAGRLQGQLEVPLNANGRRQAQQLAVRLGRDHQLEAFAAVYTSDLGRAQETANAASQVLGLRSTARADLRERHFGLLSELTLAEADVREPELCARLKARDAHFVPAGGESLSQLFSRSVVALADIARAWPRQQVVVVTHGGVIDAAWRAARGLALEVKRDHVLFNAGINRVRVEGERFELAGWNDAAHLS